MTFSKEPLRGPTSEKRPKVPSPMWSLFGKFYCIHYNRVQFQAYLWLSHLPSGWEGSGFSLSNNLLPLTTVYSLF